MQPYCAVYCLSVYLLFCTIVLVTLWLWGLQCVISFLSSQLFSFPGQLILCHSCRRLASSCKLYSGIGAKKVQFITHVRLWIHIFWPKSQSAPKSNEGASITLNELRHAWCLNLTINKRESKTKLITSSTQNKTKVPNCTQTHLLADKFMMGPLSPNNPS